MTWKIFKVFKRKSSKRVKHKETYQNPNIGSTSSALPSGGLSPIPQVQEPNTMPAYKSSSNGSIEPSTAFQTSYIGGAFDDDDVERIDINAEYNADMAIERSSSIKRESSGRDDDLSINLQSAPAYVNEAVDERPLLSSTCSDDALLLTLKPPARIESALTTCDDGGHVFEADFLRSNPDLVTARDYSKREKVLESVRHDLNAGGTKLKSATDRKDTYFIPCTTLHQIMTEQTVRLLLRECDTTLATNVINKHATEIAPPLHHNSSPFRRVFAILILIKKPLAIFTFLKNRINDSLLPFEIGEDDSPPHVIFTEDDWDDQDIRDFCRFQWEVWPVFFSGQGEKIVHYECRRGEILPFTIAKPEWKLFKKGGNGEIASYQLHPHQQSLTRYTKGGPNRAVAIKKLFKPESRVEFDREHAMLDRLTKSVPSPHLAKLLATYEMHKDSDDSGLKDYFLIFECADSTLADLWSEDPKLLMDHPELAKWVACQCQGLADALASIHNIEPYLAHDDPNDRTHGYHGDLRPDNVLRYSEWDNEEHKLGILQITDFGLSSFHHTVTVDAISIRNRSGDYRPPESELLTTVSPSLDIWTLGCLCLDFLTWLVKGPKGRKAFKTDRLCFGLLFDKHTCFWEVTEYDGVTIVTLSRAVLNWVTKLSEDRNSSQFVRDFCELIINHMLVIEDKDQASSRHNSKGTMEVEPKIPPDERIQASKLAEDMKRFLGKDISYYTPSRPRGQLKLYGQRNCLKVLKPKHQLYLEVVDSIGRIDGANG